MRQANCSTRASRTPSGVCLLLVVAVVPLPLTGCALFLVGAGAGAGALSVAYIEGALVAEVRDDPKAVEVAANKAFAALDIHEISSASTALDAEVIGRTATDTRIQVTAKALEAGESKISIRVGTFGDQTMSRRIYEQMQMHLPK